MLETPGEKTHLQFPTEVWLLRLLIETLEV